ncbi:hypothetical protein MSPP1_001155 [Malassezia sp. CBS 17886]|nr:hypothetical protein MSPP1_001155 [Malassezia sp. CBS 17886]
MSAAANKPVVGVPLASCCTVVSAAGVVILATFGYGFTHNWPAFMGATDDPTDGVAAGLTCYLAAFVYLLFTLFCVCQMDVHRRYQRIQI